MSNKAYINYRVNNEASEVEQAIYNDYWLQKPQKTINAILNHYQIDKDELNSILANAGTTTVVYTCSICKQQNETENSINRIALNHVRTRSHPICPQCNSKIKEDQKALEERRIELERLEDEYLHAEQERAKAFITEGFRQANWNYLTGDEHQFMKILCYGMTYVNNWISRNFPFTGEQQEHFLKAQDLKLVYLIKSFSTNKAIDIKFHKNLYNKLLDTNPYSERHHSIDYISLHLKKNTNESDSPLNPSFSGVIRFPENVNLSTDVEFVYGAWLLKDGSLNLKIQPTDSLNRRAIEVFTK